MQMMRKTPLKSGRGSDVHDGVEYHQMTARQDGFIDTQVLAHNKYLKANF